MAKDPLVTIVTPSYNQGRFLEETIRSVLNQDYPRLEYIIVDGGSKDNSVEIIRKYEHRMAWWVSEKDGGQADALNKGFAPAQGELMAWINSDDTYQPGAIREAVAYLQTHPEVRFVYGDANLMDVDSRVLGPFPARQTDYKRMLRGSVHIPQQSTFWQSDLWRQVGLFDTSLYFAFDYDFWVRVAKITPLVYTPRLWANFRLHSQAKTSLADSRCYSDMLLVLKRQGGSVWSPLGVKAYIRPLIYSWLPLRLRLWLRRWML